MYVNLNNVSIANLDSRGDLNGVVAKLNVNVAPGEFIFYQQGETQYYLTNNRELDTFSVMLTDDNNDQLQMNGAEWSLTLTTHFCKKRQAVLREGYLMDSRKKEPVGAEADDQKKKKRSLHPPCG